MMVVGCYVFCLWRCFSLLVANSSLFDMCVNCYCWMFFGAVVLVCILCVDGWLLVLLVVGVVGVCLLFVFVCLVVRFVCFCLLP